MRFARVKQMVNGGLISTPPRLFADEIVSSGHALTPSRFLVSQFLSFSVSLFLEKPLFRRFGNRDSIVVALFRDIDIAKAF
jgi:hypothetical protein